MPLTFSTMAAQPDRCQQLSGAQSITGA